MVLETALLDLIAERIQKVVMIIVMRAEQFAGLLHQRAMRLELLGLYHQQLGAVGKQVEMHRRRTARIEVEPCRIPARVQRTVDKGLEADRLELRARAAAG